MNDDGIREILAKRIDREKQAVGIAVGVIGPNGRRVVSYGKMGSGDPRSVDGDTIFEIGSITKVFTSLLLADMVNEGEAALDDPAAKYLPPHVRVPERSGKSITLLDLSTHRSGLPPLPGNLITKMATLKDSAGTGAEYSVSDLYDFLSGYALLRDPGSEYEYSNVGAGLLGQALTCSVGSDFEDVIRSRVTEPLGMRDTAIALTAAARQRMARGHNAMLAPAVNSDLPAALVGAGALRSSANDMLTFLEAFLGYRESRLAPAMKSMIERRRPASRSEIGLGWFISSVDGREIVWHNGGTVGFRSFAGYDPGGRVGVVVLANTSTPAGVDDIGLHLLNPNTPLSEHEAPPERTDIAIDPKSLDRYTGRYQVAENLVFEISRDGDRLFAQGFAKLPHNQSGELTGLPKFELFAEAEKSFFAKVSDSRVTFETGADGRATSLVLHKAAREPIAGPRV